jgi:hypothetical protein
MTIMDSRPTSTVHLTAGQTEAFGYFEFLFGFGVAPEVDLGHMGAYTKVFGSVWKQDYERGIGLGNLGDDAAIVNLDHPYLDLAGNVVTSVTIPGHTVKVLVNDR